MKERDIIFAARVLSQVFSPFYLPVVGLAILFVFSYLRLLPVGYQLKVLAVVYLCTVLLPTLLIRWYRGYHGWTPRELGMKERRMIPYAISIVCYLLAYYVMNSLHMPHFMSSIVIAALAIQVVCALINLYRKISMHTAAIGGVAGALLAFSLMFGFNPVGWLSVVIFVGGLIGTCRMILRQHTLPQVVTGFLLGGVLAFYAILRL